MMSTVRLTRCLRLLAVCSVLATMSCPVANAAPYVSCPGGYIVYPPQPCPPVPKHPVGGRPPVGGGGDGVLGDLLDGLGLGALGGLGGVL